LAKIAIEKIRSLTDKPISHVVLTHYHAVRVLGASAYGAEQIIMSDVARSMVIQRGQEDWDSELQRFPRLFEGHESIPGLMYPTTTFSDTMTVYLGNRCVDIKQIGRAHMRRNLCSVATNNHKGVEFGLTHFIQHVRQRRTVDLNNCVCLDFAAVQRRDVGLVGGGLCPLSIGVREYLQGSDKIKQDDTGIDDEDHRFLLRWFLW
jgi:hypothetical protein